MKQELSPGALIKQWVEFLKERELLTKNQIDMTVEQIKRGNEILARLEQLSVAKLNFKASAHFRDDSLQTRQENGYTQYIPVEFIDIETIKVLALSRINAEIQKLEEELKNL